MQSPSLLQRGLWLEYATLGWNVIGMVIILIAGVRAGSAALVGFGLDSAIEIFSSVVVVWQLKSVERGRDSLALKLIGTAFIALAIDFLVQSVCRACWPLRPVIVRQRSPTATANLHPNLHPAHGQGVRP